MKIYKFESKTCFITLEFTNSKDKDYFMGIYRVTHKSKKNGHIWALAYFDIHEDAIHYFLNLINKWIN